MADVERMTRHDLKGPLNGILGMVEILLDTELTPEQGRAAGLVKTSGEALLDILNEDGGWIACSSHNLQPDTPPENIVAMYEVLLGRELV